MIHLMMMMMMMMMMVVMMMVVVMIVMMTIIQEMQNMMMLKIGKTVELGSCSLGKNPSEDLLEKKLSDMAAANNNQQGTATIFMVNLWYSTKNRSFSGSTYFPFLAKKAQD